MGRIDRLEVDLLDPASVLDVVSAGCDVFIHSAWDTTPGQYLTSESNINYAVAGMNIVQGLARSGCRKVIGLGSCQEYALSAGPLDEKASLGPTVPYSKAKAGFGLFVDSVGQVGLMEAVWLRIFNVYGPGENEGRLVPFVIKKLLARESAAVSSGEQVRDYLHVDDVASAVFHAADSDVTGVMNVGSGIPVRVRDVVEELTGMLDGTDLVRFGERETHVGELPFVVADNRKLLSTGWAPGFSLSGGLFDTVRWWEGRHAR
jgi:nucleoside-diphosphate-sugar epimerase